MSNFSVIEVDNPEWSKVISESLNFDFYHTQSYHQLEKDVRPVLCTFSFGMNFIAMPFLIRNIPNTDLFDCTSVYGYCGPVSNVPVQDIDTDTIDNFQNHLNSFFKDNNIISAFSRLHPLIDTEYVFNNFGLVKEINKTIAIDLRIPEDEQRRQYRKSNKSELNQLRRKGFEVFEAVSQDEINTFIQIYYETMDRVGAGKNYYFSHEYFNEFLSNPCFKSKLLIAKNDNIIVAGAIFTITNKIMQYHLAGTSENYIRDTPMKLILDEARIMGNKMNMDFLHLGGGVGGSDEDSLFRFKSGFSDYYCIYKIWQMIIDEEKYFSLAESVGINDKSINFFPLYRHRV